MIHILVVVACAWCQPPQAGDDEEATHGICDAHSEKMRIESAQRQFDKIPSYVCNRKAFEEYKAKKRS